MSNYQFWAVYIAIGALIYAVVKVGESIEARLEHISDQLEKHFEDPDRGDWAQ